MGSKNDLTRKEFITLTFTLIGATAVGACDDDNNNDRAGDDHNSARRRWCLLPRGTTSARPIIKESALADFVARR